MIDLKGERFFFLTTSLLILSFANTGCMSSADGAVSTILNPIAQESSGTSQGPVLPSASPSPSPLPSSAPRTYQTDALIFNGTGVWADEVASLKYILASNGATYQDVTSDELDRMSIEELTQFGILIFPGGGGATQTKSLSAETHARLREAVQVWGVGYIGFCAGAFIAVAPAPEPGKDVSYGLGIVDGPELDYYYLEYQNKTIAMTLETFADGTQRDLLWYGGPVTPNIPGGVVAKYPNGDPAITQVWSGKGFVMLSAIHPAASQRIRDYYGLKDRDGLDFDLTWKLISATLSQKPLKAF